jgi:hypothetical protein
MHAPDDLPAMVMSDHVCGDRLDELVVDRLAGDQRR